jgi:phage shock protein C
MIQPEHNHRIMAKQVRKPNDKDTVYYSSSDLNAALDDYINEQQVPEKVRLINVPTLAGLSILGLTTLSIINGFFPWIGGMQVSELEGLIVIGGIITTVVAFGAFSGQAQERKRRLLQKKKKNKLTPAMEVDEHPSLEPYAGVANQRLFRSRTDQRLLGVCGGIAKYLGISSQAVRILWIIGSLFTAPFMIPLYFILGFVIPKQPRYAWSEKESLVDKF